MKLINLIEDTPGKTGCLYEHGLSFYIETSNHKVLLDTGATDAFIQNAEAMHIDLTTIDTCILSHGHYDHGGGLQAFVRINPHALIYMKEKAFEKHVHPLPDREKYIGIDPALQELSQIRYVPTSLRIDEELFLFSGFADREPLFSNKELKVRTENGLIRDPFDHEQCLVVTEKNQSVLLSGCAHNGIAEILERYRDFFDRDPDFVISGFHMNKKSEYTKEEIEWIRRTAKQLIQTHSTYYTGHCTGHKAYSLMKEIMHDQLHEFHSGDGFPIK